MTRHRARRWFDQPSFFTSRLLPVVLLIVAVALTTYYQSLVLGDICELTGSGVGDSSLDIRDATWFPVRDMMAGGDPYDVQDYLTRYPTAYVPYTPGHLVLWIPLAAVPWPLAAQLWAFISAGVIVVVGGLTGIRAFHPSDPSAVPTRIGQVSRFAAGVTLFWLSKGVTAAHGPGNPSIVYGLLGAVAMMGSVGPRTQVLLAALACLKPTIGLPVLILLAVTGRARIALRALALASVPTAIAVVWLAHGVSGIPMWFRTLLESASRTQSDRLGPGQAHLWMDIFALMDRVAPRVPSAVLAVIGLAILVIAGIAARRLWPRWPALATLVISVAGLISIPHGGYDTLVLTPPLLLSARELVDAGRHQVPIFAWSGWFSCLALVSAFTPRTETLFRGHWAPSQVMQVIAPVALTLLLTGTLVDHALRRSIPQRA